MKSFGPNRSFGLILAAGCAALSILSYRAGGTAKPVVWGGLGAFFFLMALAMPRVLAPARRAWLKLGLLLGKVVNPLVLGLVFLAVFIPVGGLMRLFHRDAMARRFDPAATSYWVERSGATRGADGLKEQF